MEAEKKNLDQSKDSFTHSDVNSSTDAEVPGPLAANGVFFQCPMIGKFFFFLVKPDGKIIILFTVKLLCLGLEVLSQEEWHVKIEEFIKEQMKDDPILQSILLIQNCNHNRSKVNNFLKLIIGVFRAWLARQNVISYKS